MINKTISLVGSDECLLMYISKALINEGYRVKILSRGLRSVKKLKLVAELGRIFIQTVSTDRDELYQALRGSYAVVRLLETNNVSGCDVGRDLLLAKVVKDLEIKCFVQLSCIFADYDSSQYVKEKLLLQESHNAVVLRTSIVFGENDGFISLIKQYLSFAYIVPLLNKHTAPLTLIYAGDVAKAIVMIVDKPTDFYGEVLELKGTQEYSMRKIFYEVSHALRKNIVFIGVPRILMWIISIISMILPQLAIARVQMNLIAYDSQNRLTENKHFRITQHDLKNFLQH